MITRATHPSLDQRKSLRAQQKRQYGRQGQKPLSFTVKVQFGSLRFLRLHFSKVNNMDFQGSSQNLTRLSAPNDASLKSTTARGSSHGASY